MHSPARGFTLMEVLVVMVITSFVVLVLLQALQQILRLQTHFGAEIFSTQNGAMYSDWFRQSLNSLIPDFRDGRHRFRGERRELRGLTLAPVGPEGQNLTPFGWTLSFDPGTGRTGLYYDDSRGEKAALPRDPVLSWDGDYGRFIYFDDRNSPHEQWPPFLGQWPQLPAAIHLEGGNGAQRGLIVAVPRGMNNPPPRRRELEEI